MLILLPIALLFAENTLYSLQGVTIIAAFPVGILLVLIVWAFLKTAQTSLKITIMANDFKNDKNHTRVHRAGVA